MVNKITKRVVFVMLTLMLNSFAFSLNTHAEVITKQPLIHITCQQMSSWVHIKNKQGVYQNLQSSLSDYQLTQNKKNCLKTANMSGVLVKNLVDWQQQHSNGMEATFTPSPKQLLPEQPLLSFADIASFNFTLNLDNSKSYVASQEELKATLIQLNTKQPNGKQHNLQQLQSVIDELIDGFLHLKIVFYSADHHDITKATIYGSYDLTLDLANNTEQWQAISIPVDKLTYYSEKNYQQIAKQYTQIQSSTVHGMIIMAESANDKVLRHYLAVDSVNNETILANDLMVFNEVSLNVIGLNLKLKQ